MAASEITAQSKGASGIETLHNVVGLHAVTSDGVIGIYAEGRRFVPDVELTQALGPHVRQLLTVYLQATDKSRYRIGLLYRAPEPRAWSSDTILLEKSIVRELYPVGGPPGQELTAFQRKNREKSVYRAVELLVEYRYDAKPDEPVYCPLLYDSGMSLQDGEPTAQAGSAPVPAVEVLNLLAIVPMGRRDIPAIAKLLNRTQQYLIHKEWRREEGAFAIDEKGFVRRPGTGEGDYFDVDKRHERKGTLEEEIQRRLAAAAAAQQRERFDQVERWLARPLRPADPALLRQFTQFRDLDMASVNLLCERALIYIAPGGVQLLNVGMKDSWNMYLIEGTLSLEAADGGSLLVTGGTDKAASPVSFLKPRKYNVTTRTPVSFLWIHDSLLNAVLVPPEPRPRVLSALKPAKR